MPSHPLSALSLSLRRRLPATNRKSPFLSPSPFPAWKHRVSHKPRATLVLDKATFLQLSPGSLPLPRPPAPVSALSPPRHLPRGDTKEPQCHQHSLTHHQLHPSLQEHLELQLSPKSNGIRGGNGKRRQRLLRGEAEIPPSPRQPPQQGGNFSSRKMQHFTPEMPRGSALTSTELRPHHGGNSEHTMLYLEYSSNCTGHAHNWNYF